MGTGWGKPGTDEHRRGSLRLAGRADGEKPGARPHSSTASPHRGDLAAVLIFLVSSWTCL